MRKISVFLLLILILAVPALAEIGMLPVNSVISPAVNTAGTLNQVMFVPLTTTNQVKIYNIEGTTPLLSSTITDLGGTPTGLGVVKGVSTDDDKLYVAISAGGTQAVKQYARSGGPAQATITDPSMRALRGVAVAPDGKRLYVADYLAQKIHIINIDSADTGGFNHYAGSISVPLYNLQSVAVSPDNNFIAVSSLASSGAVYVYRINHDLETGAISYSTSTVARLTGLPNSNYVLFSADSTYLYVRVNENSGAYRDLLIYKTSDFTLAPGGSIRLHSYTHEYDAQNPFGEVLSQSPNGKYLYLTHYRVVSSLPRVYFYRITARVDAAGVEVPRSDFSGYPDLSLNEGQIGGPYLPSVNWASPDVRGIRLWLTGSDIGTRQLCRDTGFNDSLGNPITGANLPWGPGIVHPKNPSDDLLNYLLNNPAHNAIEWTAPYDPDTTGGFHYSVMYKEVGGTASFNTIPGSGWRTDNFINPLPSDIFIPGHTYQIAVRAHDGFNWGMFAISQPFRIAKPVISHVNNNAGRSIDKAYTYDYIEIMGEGFGNPATTDRNSTQYNVAFNGHRISAESITSWDQSHIGLVIPRKAFDNYYLEPNVYNIVVTAFNTASDPRELMVGPKITSVAPTSGYVGDTVEIFGADFGKTGIEDINQEDSKVYFYGGLIWRYNPIERRFYSEIRWVEASIVGDPSGDGWMRNPTNPDGSTSITDRIRARVPEGAMVGRHEVRVVVNNQISSCEALYEVMTRTSGGTIVIDNYEGDAGDHVADPNPDTMGEVGDMYYTFAASDLFKPVYARQNTEKFEGTRAMRITYPAADTPENGWRGYGGVLRSVQDLSGSTHVTFYLKGNGSNQTVSVQLKDSEGDNYTVPTTPGVLGPYEFTLSSTEWHECKIPFSAFTKEITDTDHDGLDLNAITDYQLIFTGQDAAATPIYIDLVQATTEGTSGNIHTTIQRAADTVGSGVTLNWTITPAGAVDIYSISGATDAVNGVFTTIEVTSWTIEPGCDNISATTYTDTTTTGQVGAGYQKYYKVVPHGVALTSDMLMTDVVGKFDIATGPMEEHPDWFFFSIPLEQTNTAITSVIGGQVAEQDALMVFDINRETMAASYYTGGAWTSFPGDYPIGSGTPIPQITDLYPGYAYAYYAPNGTKNVTVVGKVRTASNERDVRGGWDTTYEHNKYAEWVANAFPVPVTLTLSGLNSSTAGLDISTAGVAYQFDANGELISGNQGIGIHNTVTTWLDFDGAPATMKLLPGRGYMFTDPTEGGFRWIQPRSY